MAKKSMSTAPTLPSRSTEQHAPIAGLKNANVRTTTATEHKMVAMICMPVKALSGRRWTLVDGIGTRRSRSRSDLVRAVNPLSIYRCLVHDDPCVDCVARPSYSAIHLSFLLVEKADRTKASLPGHSSVAHAETQVREQLVVNCYTAQLRVEH